MKSSMKGAFLAAAVAGLFVSGTALADHHEKSGDSETVKCTGVNECKGKGACAMADHGCAGHNACKGKGWIKMSKKECEEKGGKVYQPKKKEG